MPEFQGVIVPLVTPMTEDDRIDVAALHANIDMLLAAGVHGLVPAGSTGEAMSLDPDEYRTVLAETIDHVNRRVPVIPGCSANATRDVIAKCLQAERLGADGLMTVHPFYSLPSEPELYEHYKTVAENIHRSLIIYNNPFTTGVDCSPELFAELSKLSHIDYVKESSGDVTRVLRIQLASEGRLSVLCGTDNLALESFAAGATGWVAGAANSLPSQCVELYRLAAVTKEFDKALSLYRRLHGFLTLAESGGRFVQVNKAAVELVGGSAGSPRRPLRRLDSSLLDRTRELLNAAEPASVDGR